jgi:hypothetical protein
MSVCSCATKFKSIDSAVTTPKKSMAEYEDDDIHIGREFGFSRGDAGEMA